MFRSLLQGGSLAHKLLISLTPFDKKTPLSPPFGKGGEGGFSDRSHLTEYAILREREAMKAMKILGVSDYEFLRFPDRKLNLHFESALGRLLDIIKAIRG